MANWRARRAYAGLSAIFLFFTNCRGLQSAVDPAGPQAGRISKLWWVMLIVCSAVFVIVMAVLLYSVFRARRRNRVADEPGTEQRLTRTISGATIATLVIMFGLLVASALTGRALSSQPEQDVLTIEIVGHQWWWEVQYDDPIPARTLKTANEIHIPTGQVVMLKLTSHDVIHSFWAPNLHGKKDLIPGHVAMIWIQADKPGVYRGQCAEFCGHQHAHMAFLVVAEPPEQFADWFDKQLKSAETPADAASLRGQQVFLTSRCVMCHTIRGTAAAAISGPDLTHLASRQTIAAATLPNTADHLGNWVVNSQAAKPGNKMPPNELSPEDLQVLVRYLESLH
jgi:cytochrome c oxidase subunit 2